MPVNELHSKQIVGIIFHTSFPSVFDWYDHENGYSGHSGHSGKNNNNNHHASVLVVSTGSSICYRLLCQKLSLDRGTHLCFQGSGLGCHTAGVSARKPTIQTRTTCYELFLC